MLDPITGWLSQVDQLLTVVASIFAKLDAIFHHTLSMLSFIAGVRVLVRKSWRPVAPSARPCMRMDSQRRAKLPSPTDPSTPT